MSVCRRRWESTWLKIEATMLATFMGVSIASSVWTLMKMLIEFF